MTNIEQGNNIRWKNAIDKFKRALVLKQHELGKLREAIVDSARVRISDNSSYLQEIAKGEAYYYGSKYKMLRMDAEELKKHQVYYNKHTRRLDDYKGEIATTVGEYSKGLRDVQAFVFSKSGELYIGRHYGFLRQKDSNLSHASFLAGIPVEMAGIIGINNNGRIDYISNDSGHYIPDAFDMYRCIKKLQTIMPDVLIPECEVVVMQTGRYNPSQFMKRMEEIDEQSKTPYYEQLRNDRIKRIEQEEKRLKQISERSKDGIFIIKGSGDILKDIYNLTAEDTLNLQDKLSKITHIVARDTRQNKSTRYSINQINKSALDSNNIQTMQKLLDIGINKRPEYIESFPLHRTIWLENTPIVKLLIHNGEDINRADDDGTTPLMVAAEKGNIDIIEVLLNHGANFNIADKDGTTPLMHAIRSGNVDVVKKFINLGTNIDVQDNNGNTPIIIAVKETFSNHNIKYNMVKMLLENKANAYIKNKEGEDPSSILLEQRDLDILKMIMTHKNNLQVKGILRNKTSHVADYLAKKNVTKRLLQK